MRAKVTGLAVAPRKAIMYKKIALASTVTTRKTVSRNKKKNHLHGTNKKND